MRSDKRTVDQTTPLGSGSEPTKDRMRATNEHFFKRLSAKHEKHEWQKFEKKQTKNFKQKRNKMLQNFSTDWEKVIMQSVVSH